MVEDDFSDLPALPAVSETPTRAEVANLVQHIKHDLIGFLQSVKVGLELLEREALDHDTLLEVVALVRANCERGLAYGRMMEGYAHKLEQD